MFSPDDTGIAFKHPTDIMRKLQPYDQIAQNNHLSVNWGGEVFILIPPKNKLIHKTITELLHPPVQLNIMCSERKIFRHMMEPGEK